MTDKELMQQALAALNHVNVQDRVQIITALRERLVQPEMQPCVGRNCGSTNPNLHSAECFEDYEKATGMSQWQKTDAPHWSSYKLGWEDGVMAERQRIVNLLMIQHEMVNGAHNYWHVAAQLIQADVASDT